MSPVFSCVERSKYERQMSADGRRALNVRSASLPARRLHVDVHRRNSQLVGCCSAVPEYTAWKQHVARRPAPCACSWEWTLSAAWTASRCRSCSSATARTAWSQIQVGSSLPWAQGVAPHSPCTTTTSAGRGVTRAMGKAVQRGCGTLCAASLKQTNRCWLACRGTGCWVPMSSCVLPLKLYWIPASCSIASQSQSVRHLGGGKGIRQGPTPSALSISDDEAQILRGLLPLRAQPGQFG